MNPDRLERFYSEFKDLRLSCFIDPEGHRRLNDWFSQNWHSGDAKPVRDSLDLLVRMEGRRFYGFDEGGRSFVEYCGPARLALVNTFEPSLTCSTDSFPSRFDFGTLVKSLAEKEDYRRELILEAAGPGAEFLLFVRQCPQLVVSGDGGVTTLILHEIIGMGALSQRGWRSRDES